MIEGLSEEMQGLFAIAADLSARVKHYYIGVEHVFLACAQLDRDALSEALRAGGVSLDKVTKRLLESMSEAPTLQTDGRMLITPRLGRLLDAAGEDGGVTLATLLPLIFREGCSLPCYLIHQMGGGLEAIATQLTTAPIAASAEVQERLAQARTPALSAMGRDITQLAAEGKIDPVIGRDREIRQVALVLARKTKNNPVLIGEAGVGKTAVVEGLALRVAAGQVPPSLRDRRIIELPLSVIVAGTQYRGQFEERLNRVVDEVRHNPEIILFIDELHTLVGAGSSSGTLDAANILKPALARGDLRCIGATTIEEYHRHIEPDAALERRFSPVMVRELSLEDTVAVLEGRREGYEVHHEVRIMPEAIEAAVHLAARHVLDRRMPDKALDLLDEACARASMDRYRDEDMARWLTESEAKDGGPPEVTARDVAGVLADRTGLPLEHLLRDETMALDGLEAVLAEEAIGQEEAVHQIVGLLRRIRSTPDAAEARPASFIFAGPVGSGKRALALALAGALFRDDAVVSFNLAEYRDKIDMEKLLGAPPGYIGYDRESLLSRRLRRDPYAVVTLEHFEAAYPDVQDVFLRGLLEGGINDNQGHTIHLENAVVVIMADLDAGAESGRRPIGFAAPERAVPTHDEDKVLAQVREVVDQQVTEAVHQIVYFPPLDETALATLAQRGLDRLAAATGPAVFDADVATWLAEEATKAGGGRQALEQLIRTQVAGPLQEALAATHPGAGEVLSVERDDGELTFTVVTLPASA
jgi:ATP-dependent Clp protease ATP-binding subunit ClpC